MQRLNHDALSDAGVLIVERFLDRQTCINLRVNANRSAKIPTAILKNGHPVRDPHIRKAHETALDANTLDRVLRALKTAKPRLESHFSTGLENHEVPRVLVYRRGDFFRKHTDHPTHGNAPAYLRKRKVSVVVFLNSETKRPSPTDYCGGRLTFYRLDQDPAGETFRLPVVGAEGSLVAFRSDLVHEVTPVIVGERMSLITWFF